MKRAIWMMAVLALMLGGFGEVNADQLTTMFDVTNADNGNMFDVNVKGNALTITGFDLNLDDILGAGYSINIYTIAGTWVGNSSNSAAWTLDLQLGSVSSQGPNAPTHVNLTTPITLSANSTTGFYITATNGALLGYTLASSGVGSIAASNADLQIDVGAGVDYPFGATFTPRIWNGTIYYNVDEAATTTPEPSTLTLLGIGVASLVGYGWRRRRQSA